MVLALLTCVGALQGAPLEYKPDPGIKLVGAIRSSEEHDRIRPSVKLPMALRFEAAGKLVLLGVQHVYDASDPQALALRREFEAFRPTVALVEGRPHLAKDWESAFKAHGESGGLLRLAADAGVTAYTWEPPISSEAAALLATESPERVAMFLTLRGYFSERRTRQVPDLSVAMMLSRRQAAYGLGKVLKSLDELDALWKRDFPSLPNWRDAEERVMWPGKEHSYLNKLANTANRCRQEHFLRTMVELTRKGERVLAVAGCSHAIVLEPVLRETLASRMP